MRIWWPAALLLLGGCGQASRQDDAGPAGTVRESGPDIRTVLATPRSAFDYRYAYRLAAGRIAAVEESHARGCDRLGPARCRITAMRYAVDADDRVAAVLTLKLDPALARAYGMAATTTVTHARGVLIDSDMAGPDAVAAAGRGDTVMAKLREALADADIRARDAASPGQQQAAGKAERLRAAIAAIAEVDQNAANGVATTPVILTYASGSAVPGFGGSSDASFAAAGQTLLQSLSGLAVLLAGVGPWIVLLLGGALLVRRFVQPEEPAAPPVPPPSPDGFESRNVVRRWFQRDDHPERENVD